MASSPAASTSSSVKARSAEARSMEAAPATSAKSRTRRNSRPATRDLVGAIGGHADAEHARAAVDDILELGLGIEIEPHRYAEAVAQRIGEQARPRGRPDKREARQIDLDRTRRRPGPDDQVELEVLHGRVEDF